MLHVFDNSTKKTKTYGFVKGKPLTEKVCRIRLQLSGTKTVEAVLKRKENFFASLDNDLPEKLLSESTIFRETELHCFLQKQLPGFIVPLVFQKPGQFAYILSGKKVVPVKITVFCAADVDRAELKMGRKKQLEAEAQVEDVLDIYFNGASQPNSDWSQARNIIYSQGKCLYHDFDLSV